MDPIKDISNMIPRLDIIRLRKAEVMVTYVETIGSWEAVKRGEDFYKTALGKVYKKTRR